MKKIFLVFVLFAMLLQSSGIVFSQYTCRHMGVKDDTKPNLIQACNDAFLACEEVRLGLETISSCESACWSIGRWAWCEAYEGCLHNIDQVKPGSGEEKYMQCIEACRAKTYQTPPDCINELKICCNNVISAEEDIEEDMYDTDILDNDEPEEPELSYKIVVNDKEFTVMGDGSSTYDITAHVEDSKGKKAEYPMWIEIRTPNNIRPGTLDINKGIEGYGHMEIDAVYTAPFIEDTEKTEDADEIIDLIYIFATIEGKTQYQVIKAIIKTQAVGFDVVLKLEKEGFETKEVNTSFNKGALSGILFYMDEDDKVYLNGVKVTLDGTLGDAKQTPIHLVNESKNGSYFFDNLAKEGEDTVDVEMKLSERTKKMLDKNKQHTEAIKKRTGKYEYTGDFPGKHFSDFPTTFIKDIAEADFKKSKQISGALEMSAYGLYFIEYYSRKAEESMNNFEEYFRNTIKDTIGFVNGIWNITTGMFNIAKNDNKGLLAKKFENWVSSSNAGSGQLAATAKKTFKTIFAAMKKGIQFDIEDKTTEMGYLAEFLGGLEGVITNEFVNATEKELTSDKPREDDDWILKGVLDKVHKYYYRTYLDEISNIAKKFKISYDAVPFDIERNIKKAEETFKGNTREHDRRNELQYEWDVDTAFLTELINVSKPFAKMWLMTHYPDAATVDKAVDVAGHAFNALKAAASMNHTYEWYMLYRRDVKDLNTSLSDLFNGQTVAYNHKNEKKSLLYLNNLPNIASGVVFASPNTKTESKILADIAKAVEKKDIASVETLLKELDEIRVQNTKSREKNIQEINSNLSGLSQELIEESLDAEALTSSFEVESVLMDLRLLSLAVDQGEENLNYFNEAVSEIAKSEEDLNIKLSKVSEKIAKGEVVYQIEQNVYANLAFYISFVIAGLGLVLCLIFIIKKKRSIGVIVLCCSALLAYLAFSYSVANYKKTKDTTDSDVTQEDIDKETREEITKPEDRNIEDPLIKQLFDE
ncbi:hypothetical protein JW911_02745 [Candidatus Peregrinibacteria bacterium]|nr:hypothetical protein [Candidatus Peregrinibacteria bacterium]